VNVAIVVPALRNLSGGHRKHLRRVVPLLSERVCVEVWFAESFPDSNIPTGLNRVRRYQGSHLSIRASAQWGAAADVVFVPMARPVMNVANVPVVTMVRNMEPLARPLLVSSITDAGRNLVSNLETRVAVATSTRVIAVSRFVFDFLTLSWGTERSKIDIVEHGLELERNSSANVINTNSKTILSLGSVRPNRGLADIVHSLPLLPGWRAVHIGAVEGDPSSATGLERLAARLGVGDRFTLAGAVDAETVGELLRSSAVIAICSRTEACPNSDLEAIASGVPIVSVDLRPHTDLLEGIATFYRAGDGVSFARAVLIAASRSAGIPEQRYAELSQMTWEQTASRTLDSLCVAISAARKTGSVVR
jgi:glycosyltransferase involved in cell wall biosynthesis